MTPVVCVFHDTCSVCGFFHDTCTVSGFFHINTCSSVFLHNATNKRSRDQTIITTVHGS